MRLSEIRGQEVMEVIARIAAPIGRIAKDSDAMAAFDLQSIRDADGPKKALIGVIADGVPALLGTHSDDVAEIMAACHLVSKEEYLAERTGPKLLVDVSALLTDGELIGFLPSQDGTQE